MYERKHAYDEFQETGEIALMNQLVRKEVMDVVFDVGANHGYWSEIACCKEIHCFEPIPATFDHMFQIEKGRYRGDTKVRLNNYGLSNKTEWIDFRVDSYNDRLTSSVLDMRREYSKVVKALVVQGEEYCSMHDILKIDFLKIDTEGQEMKVLEGFKFFIAHNMIRTIQFEFGYANVLTKNLLIDYYNLLEPFGYKIGKLLPSGKVAFKSYNLQDDKFEGPNYIATCDEEIMELIRL